jgi:hypothetical protein
MSSHDFKGLHGKEFEGLCADLLGVSMSVRFERLKPGPDQGVLYSAAWSLPAINASSIPVKSAAVAGIAATALLVPSPSKASCSARD